MLTGVGFDWPEAEKERTRRETQRLVRLGALVRGACRGCGAKKTEAHHPDYSDAKNIEWLCRSCHRKLHRATRPSGESRLDRLVRMVQKRPPMHADDRALMELQALIEEHRDPGEGRPVAGKAAKHLPHRNSMRGSSRA